MYNPDTGSEWIRTRRNESIPNMMTCSSADGRSWAPYKCTKPVARGGPAPPSNELALSGNNGSSVSYCLVGGDRTSNGSQCSSFSWQPYLVHPAHIKYKVIYMSGIPSRGARCTWLHGRVVWDICMGVSSIPGRPYYRYSTPLSGFQAPSGKNSWSLIFTEFTSGRR